ncbi:hypothetical protein [Flavobacterium sp. SM2513]|uniref:hypothetical protein n=1 Tax=Flavobacterium sp. SM2513 TaxID=3424766 RepID=UPI003D7FE01B
MKKTLFLLLLVSAIGTTSAQTILNRFPIELKKSSAYFQILNAENQQHDYYAFIADKEKNTVLKYNSALFFTDSISIPRPSKKFEFMAGTAFSEEGCPTLFWSTKAYESIKAIHFDLKTRDVSEINYENNLDKEVVVDVFSKNNSLHIVSVTNENQLKFTVFSTDGKREYLTSLSSNATAIEQSSIDNFTQLILENGITNIDPKMFTPLYVGVAKVKRYLNENQFVLTFDFKEQTTVFTINLNDFAVDKKLFPYERLQEEAQSNSYLHQNVLYQLTANSEALSLAAIDFDSQNKIGSYQANSKEEIDFKNSPLLLQSDNGKRRELKKTKRLLSKIDYGHIGLSVYSTPNYNLFTIGGVREVASGGNIALGLGMVLGGAIAGSTVVEIGDFGGSANTQSIYFESFFNTNFEHINTPFQPLYIDAMSEFLNANSPSVYNIRAFQDYVILNYYDKETNEFVMRKFEDYRN